MSSRPELARALDGLAAADGRRRLVAIAGPPGAGKSTLAHDLYAELRHRGETAAVVPMDGFHLDNRVLSEKGLLARKGAPQTFDGDGFANLVRRIGAGERVYYPVFDRDRDISIAGAAELSPDTDYVLFEGNYLLCDVPPWDGLLPLWSFTVFVDPGRDVIARRLLQRWRDQGLSEQDAIRRRDGNDMPNADFVLANSIVPDLRV
ncbi:nucleoside/nucleotide kinase family protein [Roseibacterium sp. SDUM158017]|uniref:nucleoside/nucleotide kinase family protein n=1 Tax=Roseicyclus salinarum TaxID=3036773 RepID=UPI002415269B|nr:nucleoside/nucleotide kinase family protein [Roseibacterium sp. SDUM158017]MDG4648184.1 nucleoside/nucleotide kinase family protein [Roseibacterium sp. SDUM158017]